MEIAVEDKKFNTLDKFVCCSTIAEKKTIPATVFIQNKEYAITGSSSSGANGFSEFYAQEVVNILNYKKKEKINELDYYEGMVVKFGKRNVVLTNEVTIVNSKSGMQTDLFA